MQGKKKKDSKISLTDNMTVEMKEEKATLGLSIESGSGTKTVECCMCGDHGLSEELVPCSSCNFRFQHRYCSNQYPDAESYDTCNWCLSTRNNGNGTPREKHGRMSSQELLNSCSSSPRKKKSGKGIDGPAKKRNMPPPPRRRITKDGDMRERSSTVMPMKYVLRNRAKRYKLLDEVST